MINQIEFTMKSSVTSTQIAESIELNIFDFSCSDDVTQFRGPRPSTDSSGDELFVLRRVDIP